MASTNTLRGVRRNKEKERDTRNMSKLHRLVSDARLDAVQQFLSEGTAYAPSLFSPPLSPLLSPYATRLAGHPTTYYDYDYLLHDQFFLPLSVLPFSRTRNRSKANPLRYIGIFVSRFFRAIAITCTCKSRSLSREGGGILRPISRFLVYWLLVTRNSYLS